MKFNDFIVTNKMPQRYYRHILFWGVRFLYFLQFSVGTLFFFHGWTALQSIQTAVGYSFFLVLAEIGYTYAIVYGLIPKFFPSRKVVFILGVLFFSALLVWVESPVFIQLYLLDHLPKYSFELTMECIILTTATSHFICILFIACVLFKKYYLTMKERSRLIVENANAEMQLLKAQVHPHFLFNTLNNIYSFALNKSIATRDLIIKLSDTLKYIVNECDTSLVPVEKELKLIRDYTGLESVRYGDRLKINIEITGDYNDKFIAPLLLIPFVENCFKHGASKSLTHPKIDINILISQERLILKVANNKPVASDLMKGGIGLGNVRKRLQLLYPASHSLRIMPTEDMFLVELEVPIGKGENKKLFGEQGNELSPSYQNI